MKKLIYHIIKGTLGILLVGLAMAKSGSAQHIQITQCDTMTFAVTSRPNIDDTHFVWDIYNASSEPTDVLDYTTNLDRATYFADGQYAGRSVDVTGLEPGMYYVRIHLWDEISCTDNVEMYVLEVLEEDPFVDLYADSVCVGEPSTVTIVFSGLGPYSVSYIYGDEITGNHVNLNGTIVNDNVEVVIPLPAMPDGTYEFIITRIMDDCMDKIYEEADRPRTGVVIYPKPINSEIYPVDN